MTNPEAEHAAPPHCSVCANAADRALLLEVHGHDDEAELTRSGERSTITVDLIPGAAAGDTVLFHQGVAIVRVPAPSHEAARSYAHSTADCHPAWRSHPS